jgi:hypothetical protein
MKFFFNHQKCLKHAIDIEPNNGFSKYMTLGEVLEGEQAVECLKKGIEIMINEKETHEKVKITHFFSTLFAGKKSEYLNDAEIFIIEKLHACLAIFKPLIANVVHTLRIFPFFKADSKLPKILAGVVVVAVSLARNHVIK